MQISEMDHLELGSVDLERLRQHFREWVKCKLFVSSGESYFIDHLSISHMTVMNGYDFLFSLNHGSCYSSSFISSEIKVKLAKEILSKNIVPMTNLHRILYGVKND